MRRISAEPIGAEAFAPFGCLIEAGGSATTIAGRPGSRTVIERKTVPASGHDPHLVETLERHPSDSQAFLPLDRGAYLVVVCPDDAMGGPDVARARAFAVPGSMAIQYHPAIWHAGMSGLARPVEMAIVMDRDFSAGDCEFRSIADTPIGIVLNAEAEG